MASYASLVVFTRELTILAMWVGQLLCEASNYVLKHLFKQRRPNGSSRVSNTVVPPGAVALSVYFISADLGDGYGFPSSHSQYMAYFTTFLICHLVSHRHFAPTGSKLVDSLLRVVIAIGLIAWAGGVAYSRWVFYLPPPPPRAPVGIDCPCSKVCPGLSFCPASVVGSWDWDHLWDDVLHPNGMDTGEVAQELSG